MPPPNGYFGYVWSLVWTALMVLKLQPHSGRPHLAIMELGGARPSDRTMLDALIPSAAAFHAALDAGEAPARIWAEGSRAAREAATSTAKMHPRAGGAVHLGERPLGHADAGAVAVTHLALNHRARLRFILA